MPVEKPNPLYGVMDALSDQYRRIVAPLIPEITAEINAGKDPAQAVRDAFREHGINPAVRDAILNAMVKSAALGYGVPFDALPKDGSALRAQFMENSWEGQTNFSDQIIAGELRNVVISEIRESLKRVDSFTQMAAALSDPLRLDGTGKDYVKADIAGDVQDLSDMALRIAPLKNAQDVKEFRAAMRQVQRRVNSLADNGAPTRTLRATYQNVIDAAQTFRESTIQKAVAQAVRDKARYNAERIARTEMARAYGTSFDVKNINDTDAVGVQFVLSTRHSHACICNFWTSANLYGMGAGVYPKALQPSYPFHPHCLCLKVGVFKHQAVPSNALRDGAGQKALEDMTKEQREDILGIEGNKDFERNPLIWKELLPGYEDPKEISTNGLTEGMFGQ